MNKYDPKLIYSEALDFIIASDLLYSRAVLIGIKMESIDRCIGITFVSYANHAFAFELLLKCLHVILTEKHPEGHDLNKLYKNLPVKIKKRIIEHYDKNGRYLNTTYDKGGWPKHDGFEETLESSIKPFYEFRYMYAHRLSDNYTTPSYKLRYALKSVQAIILEVMPDIEDFS